MKDKSKKPPVSCQNTESDSPYRLNITLDQDQKTELEALKILAQKASLVDVIRAALSLFKIIIEHRNSGGKVILRNKDGKDETLYIL